MRCLSGGDDGSFRGERCEQVTSLRSPRSPMGAREVPLVNGLGFQDIGAFLWRGKFPLRNPSREGSCGRYKENHKG